MATGLLSLLPIVLVTVVLVKAVQWLLSYRSFFKLYNSLPGETDFSWVWGNAHKLRAPSKQRIAYMLDLTKKFPYLYRTWYGPFRPVVSAVHPDTIKPVLKIAGPKPWSYDIFKPWLGEGLLIAKGHKWHRSRRLLTPAFHFDILKHYNTEGNQACETMLHYVGKSAAAKTSLEMFNRINLCTLDVLLRCAMSRSDDVQSQGEAHPYVKAINSLTNLGGERFRNPLMGMDWVYNLTSNGRKFRELCDYVHDISDEVISDRQKTLAQDGPPKKRHLDFIDLLLTARDGDGKGLTHKEIRAEVDTFMFEGHDTTASGISWALYCMCTHPEYQRRVQAEVDQLLAERDTDDILWEDLPKMEWTTLVIKESLRLYGAVPAIGRFLEEDLTVAGTFLPAGTVVQIHIYNLHHNPLVWDAPEEFRPERFLSENTQGRDSHAYIPFSAGPRNCIGQHFAMNEQKVMLCRLLRRFTFTLDPNYTVSELEGPIWRTETGMRMFATPRTPAA